MKYILKCKHFQIEYSWYTTTFRNWYCRLATKSMMEKYLTLTNKCRVLYLCDIGNIGSLELVHQCWAHSSWCSSSFFLSWFITLPKLKSWACQFASWFLKKIRFWIGIGINTKIYMIIFAFWSRASAILDILSRIFSTILFLSHAHTSYLTPSVWLVLFVSITE